MSICKKDNPALLGRMFKLTLINGRAALSLAGRLMALFEGAEEIEEIVGSLLDTHRDFVLESTSCKLIVRGFPDGTCSYREMYEN